jgi:hypothetical protein
MTVVTSSPRFSCTQIKLFDALLSANIIVYTAPHSTVHALAHTYAHTNKRGTGVPWELHVVLVFHIRHLGVPFTAARRRLLHQWHHFTTGQNCRLPSDAHSSRWGCRHKIPQGTNTHATAWTKAHALRFLSTCTQFSDIWGQ